MYKTVFPTSLLTFVNPNLYCLADCDRRFRSWLLNRVATSCKSGSDKPTVALQLGFGQDKVETSALKTMLLFCTMDLGPQCAK